MAPIAVLLLLTWQQEQLTRETRRWEQVMALPRHEIRFVEDLGRIGDDYICGLSLREGVAYSTRKECKKWEAHDLALHEMCHYRMQHIDSSLTREETEMEVAACAKAYAQREKR